MKKYFTQLPILKSLIFLYYLSCSVMPAGAQEIDTVFNAGGNWQETFKTFAKDKNGNFYVVFQAHPNVNFFGTPVIKPNGYGTVYTIYGKLDSAMNVLWVKTMNVSGGTGVYTSNKLIIDDADNFYYLEGGSKQLVKFSSTGDIIWVKDIFAERIFFNEHGQLECHQYQGKNDSINGQPINNIQGTVAFFDTSGSYIRHFIIDDPNYEVEMIHGRSKDGYYGSRRKTYSSSWPKRNEVFISDSVGNIIKISTVNFNYYNSASYIVYDPIHQFYYIHGTFRETDPLDLEDSTTLIPRNNYIVQMNRGLEITRTLKLSDYINNSSTYYFIMNPHNGSLYLSFPSQPLYYTHLGVENHLNTNIQDHLVLAKIDHTLNVKWYNVLKYPYYVNKLTSFSFTEDELYFVGTSSNIDYKGYAFIPNGPHDVIVLKMKDHDSTSAYLKGKVFFDKNKNGIDDNEDGVPLVKIVNDQASGANFTVKDGSFKVGADTGTNILKALSIPKYWNLSTPDSIISYVNSFDTVIHGFKFGIYPVEGIRDASVMINTLTAARPGFRVAYKLTYENKANDTLQGVVHFKQDSALVFMNASVTPDSIDGQNLFWTYTSLEPGESREIIITDSLKNDINLLSDTLIIQAYVSPFYPDTIPQNNVDTLYHIVTGSYDPNDIAVTPACINWDFVNNNDFLEYTIRFQNTGTDTAFSVILRDTLPDLLDMNSFAIVDASHDNYTLELQGNLLFVHFKNILLPHEAINHIGSHGYFKYKIKLDASNNAGAIISNKAYIYFDFNPPIITNTILIQYPFFIDTVSLNACKTFNSPSGKYTWNVSGIYSDTLPSVIGCDSIFYIDLTISTYMYDSLDVLSCDSYSSPSSKYIWTRTGIYRDTISNSTGCDTIKIIDLKIENSTATNLVISSCDQLISPSGKHIWNQSGIYNDTIFNMQGCDSIITVDLTIKVPVVYQQSILGCDSIFFNGNNYFSSQQVIDTFHNTAVNGCDSIVISDIIINNSVSYIQTLNDCYSVFFNDSIYYKDQTITNIYPGSSSNCDSIVITHIVIDSKYYTEDLTACNKYISPSGRYIWIESGIYTDTIFNVIACGGDIFTINLTINKIDTTINVSGNALTSNEISNYYQWVDCTRNYEWIAGEQNKTFYPSESGNYAVIIKKNNCTDTSACYFYSATLINGVSPMAVKLYPNPTSGKITLELGKNYDNVSLIIFNSIGQLIKRYDFDSGNLLDMYIEGAAGFYIIELKIGTDTNARFKIMKE